MKKRDVTPKQQLAISSLIAGNTHQKAAEAANVHPNRIGEWMHDPAFLAGLRAAEGDILDQVARRLLARQEAATVVLSNLAMDTATPAGVRVRAAVALLEMSLRLREMRTIEDRITALEAVINGKPQQQA